jgi:hypothetical protein
MNPTRHAEIPAAPWALVVGIPSGIQVPDFAAHGIFTFN